MDVTDKKRKGVKNLADEEEVPEGDSKLVMVLARLVLQHESEKTSPCQERQRRILDALFGRNGEGFFSGRQTSTETGVQQ